nr:ribonuclease H-like domain-containing protein [Tanacetum cinerariifolium]
SSKLFGDSYKAPPEETGKARTTLLLAIPDEHQLRFSKYETAKELWEAILKTFGGNEATKKTKKNQLKLHYGNFKAEGSETLEQTFNRLQAIKSRQRKKESYKQGPKEEEHALKALMAIDDIGWDWSYMADEEENHALVADDKVPTEFALTAKSRSSSKNEVYDDSYCSKSCRKNTKNLDTKISKLNEELSDCETDLYNYKRGLS